MMPHSRIPMTDLEQVGKAAPHMFFVKHGGKAVKNPHYLPAAKRKKAK